MLASAMLVQNRCRICFYSVNYFRKTLDKHCVNSRWITDEKTDCILGSFSGVMNTMLFLYLPIVNTECHVRSPQ